MLVTLIVAEKEGFEPPVPLGTLVFKTSAFNRSAISPVKLLLVLLESCIHQLI